MEQSIVSSVGLVTIVLGVLVVWSRGALFLAPAATLGWFKKAISTKGRVRVMGLFLAALGAAMIWAGAPDDTTLEWVLLVCGRIIVVFSTPALLLFPGVYQSMAGTLMPDDLSGDLTLWRFAGLLGAVVGAVFIYYGVLAL